jgi:tRNA-Thr(GGU) m(6)t(6)A37 methyltransferase TsaA
MQSCNNLIPSSPYITARSVFESVAVEEKMDTTDVIFRPIGNVLIQASDEEMKEGNRELISTIEIFPEFQEGMVGLEGCSHIFVLTYFNQLRPDQIGPLKVKPRRYLRKGLRLDELPLVGVFAIDSPTRPNPIGLTLVKLLRIEGRKLIVQGLDCFNGTPVLDIKPYKESYALSDYTFPEWRRRLRDMAGEDL